MGDEDNLAHLLLPPASVQTRSSYGTTSISKPHSPRVPNSLPWFQLSVVLLIRTCDAVATQSVYPYINQLVGELEVVGGDKRKVGYYVGLIDSFYQACLILTILQWNRLSDRIGRKPVLLIGVLASISSTICFGLSSTFWKLIASRCVLGLLDGNVGVVRSIIGELTDSTNRARGFALMEVMWSIGGGIGPVIGGTLARPADHLPSFNNAFWIKFPYLLPNLAVSVIIGISFLAVLFLFQETVHNNTLSSSIANERVESSSLLPSPTLFTPKPHQVFTRPVIVAASNYTALAVLGTCKQALFSLFAAMPIDIGGLGLDPERIGYIIGLYHIASAVCMATFFPRVVAWYGERRTFLLALSSVFVVWALFPVINMCARRWGVGRAVWMGIWVIGIQDVILDMAFGCVYVFITSAAPNQRSLGATNGMALTSAAIARTIAPEMATSLFSFSVEHDLLNGYAVYLVMFLLSCGALWLAMQLPLDVRPAWERDGNL